MFNNVLQILLINLNLINNLFKMIGKINSFVLMEVTNYRVHFLIQLITI